MSNQHLQDDVFFRTPKGQRTTLLERRGNKLALYTEDDQVYKRFRQWSQMIYEVRYTRAEKYLVAVDLYFPLKAKKQLLRALQAAVPKIRVPVS